MPEQGFIVFSDDWGEHPSSSQHLFRRIAATHDVLWVNTIGMRKPQFSWSDLAKARRKVRKMLDWKSDRAKKRDDPPRLMVCQPFMLPFSNNAFVRWVNVLSVRRTIKKRLRKIGMQHPILVSSVPNACDIVGQLGEKCSVYYCVDDFSQWSGYDHDLVREMNDALLKKADIILATSDYLQGQLRQSGKPVSLLTHGVDIDHFSLIPEREHPILATIKSPRIGFFGLVDDRINQDLIYVIARARPDVSFVFAGPVLDIPHQLRDLPNVRFIGTIAYAHMPFLVAGLSALILPYKIDDSTAAIAPLKLKEYIATGRPIIATPMAEVVPFKDHVVCHTDSDGWIKAVDAALQKPMDKGQQRIPEWLKTQSWDHKAEQMLTLMTRE